MEFQAAFSTEFQYFCFDDVTWFQRCCFFNNVTKFLSFLYIDTFLPFWVFSHLQSVWFRLQGEGDLNDILEVLQDLTGSFMSEKQREVPLSRFIHLSLSYFTCFVNESSSIDISDWHRCLFLVTLSFNHSITIVFLIEICQRYTGDKLGHKSI